MRTQRPRQQRRSEQPLATKRLANKGWSAVLAEPSSIRRPPLAVMSVCETFEPSLAWPKSARIGFYGLRQHRRPMLGRCDIFANLVGNFSQGRPWKFPSFFFRPWRPPRALLESSWRGSRAQEAAKALPEAPGVVFWRHVGSQNGAFFGFCSSFRSMVFFACIWIIFCSTFFLFEGCSRSARKRRTRRLYRKNKWFKAYF